MATNTVSQNSTNQPGNIATPVATNQSAAPQPVEVVGTLSPEAARAQIAAEQQQILNRPPAATPAPAPAPAAAPAPQTVTPIQTVSNLAFPATNTQPQYVTNATPSYAAPEVAPSGQGQAPTQGSGSVVTRPDYATTIPQSAYTPNGQPVTAQSRIDAVVNLARQGMTDPSQLQQYLNVTQAGGLPSGYTVQEIQNILAQNPQARPTQATTASNALQQGIADLQNVLNGTQRSIIPSTTLTNLQNALSEVNNGVVTSDLSSNISNIIGGILSNYQALTLPQLPDYSGELTALQNRSQELQRYIDDPRVDPVMQQFLAIETDNAMNRIQQIQDIQERSQQQYDDQVQANKEADARAQVAMAGARLTGSPVAEAYLTSVALSGRRALTEITKAQNQAINEAERAYRQDNIQLALKKIDVAEQRRNQYFDLLDKQVQVEQNLYQAQVDRINFQQAQAEKFQKYRKDTLDQTVSNLVQAEEEPSRVYFQQLDEQFGFDPGTSEITYKAAKNDYEQQQAAKKLDLQLKQFEVADKLQELQQNPVEYQKKVLEVQEMSQKIAKNTIDQVSQLKDIMQSWPTGVPLTINDATYFGIEGGAIFEAGPSGTGRLLYRDTATGEDRVMNMEFIGKPDDLVTVYQDGVPMLVNKKTSVVSPITRGVPGQAPDVQWDRLIPSGVDGGQCGEFCHNIVTDYPYGLNTIEQKRSVINVPANQVPQVGDIVIQAVGGPTGHVGVVNWVGQGPDGKPVIRLTESNFNLDEKVTHGRTLKFGDPTIQGYYRGSLNPKFIMGTDGMPTGTQRSPQQANQSSGQLSFSRSPFTSGRQTEAQYQDGIQKENEARQAAGLVASGSYSLNDVTKWMSADVRNRTLQLLSENNVPTGSNTSQIPSLTFDQFKAQREQEMRMSITPEAAKQQYGEYEKGQESIRSVLSAISRGKYDNLEQKSEFVAQANEAARSGDLAALESIAEQVAMKSLSESRRSNVSIAMNLVEAYTSGQQLLSSFSSDPGFRTGKLKSIIEKAKKSGSFDADPRYTQLEQLLTTFQNEYRNNLFGASLTPQEMAEANKAIIDISTDTPRTAWDKMANAVKIQRFISEAAIADALGMPRPSLANYMK